MLRPLWLALVMCYMIALIAIWVKSSVITPNTEQPKGRL